MFSLFSSKRNRLSTLAAQTQKLLFYFCFTVAIVLGSIHLFVMNYVSMQGYVFTKENEKQIQLAQRINQLDAQIAQIESREYLSKTKHLKAMIPQGSPQFFMK